MYINTNNAHHRNDTRYKLRDIPELMDFGVSRVRCRGVPALNLSFWSLELEDSFRLWFGVQGFKGLEFRSLGFRGLGFGGLGV